MQQGFPFNRPPRELFSVGTTVGPRNGILCTSAVMKKWTVAMIYKVYSNMADEADEVHLRSIVDGKEISFTEWTDNLQILW